MKYEFKINKISGELNKKEVVDGLCAIEGVISAEINLGTGHTTVDCGEDIGLDVFAAVVEEAGCIFVWDKEGK